MKERELKIILYWFILTWLLMLIFSIGGCKDEAEAEDYDDFATMIEFSEPEEIWLSIEIEDEPNFADGEDRIYLYEDDDFDVVIEKKEPNEPEKE